MNINIEALDTLFFRDGKPFTMGQDTSVQSLTFPPMPSVIYGALRSSYIAQNIDEKELENLIIESENLKIYNLALRKITGLNSEVLFPVPKDLVVPKELDDEENKGNYVVGLSKTEESIISNGILNSFLIHSDNKKLKSGKFYLTMSDLSYYLKGNIEDMEVQDIEEDSLVQEIKIGIGRENPTKIAKDGLLYKISMVRPNNGSYSLALTVDIGDSLALKTSSLAQLGGERKAVQITQTSELNLAKPKIEGNSFKLYLATPAIFESGWKPQQFLEKFNLEIISAAIDKPIHIGGWDVKNNAPKSMYKAIPAGAVYYLKAKNQHDVMSAINYIDTNRSVSEFGTDKQGFGLAFIAKHF